MFVKCEWCICYQQYSYNTDLIVFLCMWISADASGHIFSDVPGIIGRLS